MAIRDYFTADPQADYDKALADKATAEDARDSALQTFLNRKRLVERFDKLIAILETRLGEETP